MEKISDSGQEDGNEQGQYGARNQGHQAKTHADEFSDGSQHRIHIACSTACYRAA